MQKLDCAVQNYAWGKAGRESFVAKLLPAERVFEDRPYAELWMGTHPNGPSRLSNGTSLQEHLQKHAESLLGEHERAVRGLQFLFKILSVASPLSIQSHPDKALARQLHARDPKNYPDDNHKPEMAIALTEFELLCGFQSPQGIISNIKAHRELLELVGDEQLLDQLAHGPEEDDPKAREALRRIFGQVWGSPGERVAHVVAQIVERLKKKSDRSPVDDLVLRLDTQFPGGADIGVLAPFFLHFFTLQPGEATFLGPNEPHAYLSGDCVECMALSDNTIRAGLTPKFRDVATLCASLTYKMHARPPKLEAKKLEDRSVEYAPPVAEFAVHRIDHLVSTLAPQAAGSILCCVAGAAVLAGGLPDGGADQPVAMGDVLFIPRGIGGPMVKATPDFLAFRAFTPPATEEAE